MSRATARWVELLIDEYIAFPSPRRRSPQVRPQVDPSIRSTSVPSYASRMSFVVHFEDETTTIVDDADSYEQEGPLTTFFDRNGGGRLSSSFAVRVASFRTAKIVEVRRGISSRRRRDASADQSIRSSSSTTTSHRCAHSPQR